MLQSTLVYYLGESVYEDSLKDLGFLELIDIASKCRSENSFTKNAVKV